VLRLIEELEEKIEARDRQKRVPVYVPQSQPIVASTPPPPKPKPVYKRWWLWTLVGIAAGGAAAGIYFGTRSRDAEIPNSDYFWDVRPTR
jgi:hypothetical protein